jgi:hypothetical protein
MEQAVALFLYRYPSPIGSGRLGRQAWKFLFYRVVSSARNPELTL